MEWLEWVYREILDQAATIKSTILSIFGSLPLIKDLPDRALQWIFVAITFITAVFVIYPLIKWSARVALVATIIAGALTLFTSMSFWRLLPFTGLGVAIVNFSNRSQTG